MDVGTRSPWARVYAEPKLQPLVGKVYWLPERCQGLCCGVLISMVDDIHKSSNSLCSHPSPWAMADRRLRPDQCLSIVMVLTRYYPRAGVGAAAKWRSMCLVLFVS